MYTVLIMAKKTADNMYEHYPAIRNIIEKSCVEICSWNIYGNTVETALPELYDVVDNNKEWRAVVVMYDEDSLDSSVNKTNPYDYYMNDENKSDEYFNSMMSLKNSNEIPLIRLTHFLSGAPVPPPDYELRQVGRGENYNDDEPTIGEPYSVYEIIGGEERYKEKIKVFQEWNTNNTMEGLAPTELFLVKTRDITHRKDMEGARQAWAEHNESDSSDFWRRNLYPHNSRFLLFDIEKKGVMYEERDAFNFWVSLLTLISNNIDSNILQPQKIYSFKTKTDSNKLMNIFQDSVKELNLAKYKLTKDLENKEYIEDVDDEIPDYHLLVPVELTDGNNNSSYNKNFKVRLWGGVNSTEAIKWKDYTINTYLETSDLIKNIDRQLEMSALSFRDKCEYSRSEVKILDKYVEEDFKYRIHDTYDEILKSQKKLPKGIISYHDEMKNMDEIVRKDIAERMSLKQILTVIIGSIVCFSLFLLPAIYQDSSQNEFFILLFVSTILIGGIGLLTVILQRRKICNHIKLFKRFFGLMRSELDDSSKLYRIFLGNIASHIHGSSYLKEMNRKKSDFEKAIGIKKTHLGFIDEFKGRLALWSSALRVPINMDALDEFVILTGKNEIDYYNLYSLSLDDRYRNIPLNETGYPVETPFNFVDQLIIEREEVYDDI